MSRRLIIGERIMYVDAFTALNCVFHVKIKGDIALGGLNVALNKIQQKHPLLRATIQTDKNAEPWFISDPEIKPIPVRIVERTCDEDWAEQSKIEWGELFGEHMPMARLVWIKGAEISDLLLVCPHCICDGTSFVSLMSDLLMLLDQPEMELPGYPSFESVKKLVAKSFVAKPLQILKARLLALLAKVFFFFKQSVNKHAVGDNYMLNWSLTNAETTALMAKCKTNETTVHAALCVAFITAFRVVKGSKAHGKVISPIDIRRFINEIKGDHLFAFAPIAELSIEKKSLVNFWQNARQIKQSLASKIVAMNVYELLVMSEYFKASVKKMIKFLKATDGTHDVTLSNMGRLTIPRQYTSFEILAIYSPSLAFPWRNPNTAIISSFNGVMNFTFCSNTGFLAVSDAEAIKNIVIEVLNEV